MQRAIEDKAKRSDAEAIEVYPSLTAARETLLRFWESRGLPSKLLLLTAAFVLMAEALIFLPSVANYRISWLQERLTAAQLAALASEAFPGGEVPSALRADLLRTAQVRAIASRREGERRLVLPVDGELTIDAVYDLRGELDSAWDGAGLKLGHIRDALGTIFRARVASFAS